MRKKLLGMITVLGLMCCLTVPCVAEQAGLSATVKNTIYNGQFYYGNGGNVLRINSMFYEKHSTTGQVYSNSREETVAPGYTSVAVTRKSDLGYNYTTVNFWGYVNGLCKATLMGVKS